MKIEEGKYYRTRDGRKVGPARRSGGMGCFEFPGEWVYVHDADGTYSMDDRSLDLIAEWVDGPVREVTRKEIVDGVYGCLKVKAWGPSSCVVEMPSSVNGFVRSASELRAAATVLTQLADALDEQ